MSEADIIQNKFNVLLAKHQRLLASWLPPPSSAEQAASVVKGAGLLWRQDSWTERDRYRAPEEEWDEEDIL